MIVETADQVHTLRLKAGSREQLSNAIRLLEEALRIACRSCTESNGLPPGKGALIFIRKIRLGKIELNSHAEVIADVISEQIRRGALRVACLDTQDSPDADVVWLSDAIVAWSRLLTNTSSTHWYWPLLARQLGAAAASVTSDVALKIIDYRFGANGVQQLLKQLLKIEKLQNFLEQLPESAISVSGIANARYAPAEANTDSPVSQSPFAASMQQFSPSERAYLSATFLKLQTSEKKALWLLQNLTRDVLWLQRLTPNLRRAAYQQILQQFVRPDSSVKTAIENPEFANDEFNETLVDRSEKACSFKDEQTITAEIVQEVLGESWDADRDENMAEVSPEVALNAEQYTRDSHLKTGVYIPCAGGFFVLNLLDSLIPNQTYFAKLPLAPKTAIWVWLLHRLGCEDMIHELSLDEYLDSSLYSETLKNAALSPRWQAWVTQKNIALTLPASTLFGDYIRMVVSIISRFLWRETGAGIRSLSRQGGELLLTHTHIDLFLDSAKLSLPVRKLGLDISPGWLPWLGKVVTLHYRDAQVHELFPGARS